MQPQEIDAILTAGPLRLHSSEAGGDATRDEWVSRYCTLEVDTLSWFEPHVAKDPTALLRVTSPLGDADLSGAVVTPPPSGADAVPGFVLTFFNGAAMTLQCQSLAAQRAWLAAFRDSYARVDDPAVPPPATATTPASNAAPATTTSVTRSQSVRRRSPTAAGTSPSERHSPVPALPLNGLAVGIASPTRLALPGSAGNSPQRNSGPRNTAAVSFDASPLPPPPLDVAAAVARASRLKPSPAAAAAADANPAMAPPSLPPILFAGWVDLCPPPPAPAFALASTGPSMTAGDWLRGLGAGRSSTASPPHAATGFSWLTPAAAAAVPYKAGVFSRVFLMLRPGEASWYDGDGAASPLLGSEALTGGGVRVAIAGPAHPVLRGAPGIEVSGLAPRGGGSGLLGGLFSAAVAPMGVAGAQHTGSLLSPSQQLQPPPLLLRCAAPKEVSLWLGGFRGTQARLMPAALAAAATFALPVPVPAHNQPQQSQLQSQQQQQQQQRGVREPSPGPGAGHRASSPSVARDGAAGGGPGSGRTRRLNSEADSGGGAVADINFTNTPPHNRRSMAAAAALATQASAMEAAAGAGVEPVLIGLSSARLSGRLFEQPPASTTGDADLDIPFIPPPPLSRRPPGAGNTNRGRAPVIAVPHDAEAGSNINFNSSSGPATPAAPPADPIAHEVAAVLRSTAATGGIGARRSPPASTASPANGWDAAAAAVPGAADSAMTPPRSSAFPGGGSRGGAPLFAPVGVELIEEPKPSPHAAATETVVAQSTAAAATHHVGHTRLFAAAQSAKRRQAPPPPLQQPQQPVQQRPPPSAAPTTPTLAVALQKQSTVSPAAAAAAAAAAAFEAATERFDALRRDFSAGAAAATPPRSAGGSAGRSRASSGARLKLTPPSPSDYAVAPSSAATASPLTAPLTAPPPPWAGPAELAAFLHRELAALSAMLRGADAVGTDAWRSALTTPLLRAVDPSSQPQLLEALVATAGLSRATTAPSSPEVTAAATTTFPLPAHAVGQLSCVASAAEAALGAARGAAAASSHGNVDFKRVDAMDEAMLARFALRISRVQDVNARLEWALKDAVVSGGGSAAAWPQSSPVNAHLIALLAFYAQHAPSKATVAHVTAAWAAYGADVWVELAARYGVSAVELHAAAAGRFGASPARSPVQSQSMQAPVGRDGADTGATAAAAAIERQLRSRSRSASSASGAADDVQTAQGLGDAAQAGHGPASAGQRKRKRAARRAAAAAAPPRAETEVVDLSAAQAAAGAAADTGRVSVTRRIDDAATSTQAAAPLSASQPQGGTSAEHAPATPREASHAASGEAAARLARLETLRAQLKSLVDVGPTDPEAAAMLAEVEAGIATLKGAAVTAAAPAPPPVAARAAPRQVAAAATPLRRPPPPPRLAPPASAVAVASPPPPPPMPAAPVAPPQTTAIAGPALRTASPVSVPPAPAAATALSPPQKEATAPAVGVEGVQGPRASPKAASSGGATRAEVVAASAPSSPEAVPRESSPLAAPSASRAEREVLQSPPRPPSPVRADSLAMPTAVAQLEAPAVPSLPPRVDVAAVPASAAPQSPAASATSAAGDEATTSAPLAAPLDDGIGRALLKAPVSRPSPRVDVAIARASPLPRPPSVRDAVPSPPPPPKATATAAVSSPPAPPSTKQLQRQQSLKQIQALLDAVVAAAAAATSGMADRSLQASPVAVAKSPTPAVAAAAPSSGASGIGAVAARLRFPLGATLEARGGGTEEDSDASSSTSAGSTSARSVGPPGGAPALTPALPARPPAVPLIDAQPGPAGSLGAALSAAPSTSPVTSPASASFNYALASPIEKRSGDSSAAQSSPGMIIPPPPPDAATAAQRRGGSGPGASAAVELSPSNGSAVLRVADDDEKEDEADGAGGGYSGRLAVAGAPTSPPAPMSGGGGSPAARLPSPRTAVHTVIASPRGALVGAPGAISASSTSPRGALVGAPAAPSTATSPAAVPSSLRTSRAPAAVTTATSPATSPRAPARYQPLPSSSSSTVTTLPLDVPLPYVDEDVPFEGSAPLRPGLRIRLLDGPVGVLRFVGPVRFAPGEWLGLELDEPTGTHDGTVAGVRYFSCSANEALGARPGSSASLPYAIFVRRHRVARAVNRRPVATVNLPVTPRPVAVAPTTSPVAAVAGNAVVATPMPVASAASAPAAPAAAATRVTVASASEEPQRVTLPTVPLAVTATTTALSGDLSGLDAAVAAEAARALAEERQLEAELNVLQPVVDLRLSAAPPSAEESTPKPTLQLERVDAGAKDASVAATTAPLQPDTRTPELAPTPPSAAALVTAARQRRKEKERPQPGLRIADGSNSDEERDVDRAKHRHSSSPTDMRVAVAAMSPTATAATGAAAPEEADDEGLAGATPTFLSPSERMRLTPTAPAINGGAAPPALPQPNFNFNMPSRSPEEPSPGAQDASFVVPAPRPPPQSVRRSVSGRGLVVRFSGSALKQPGRRSALHLGDIVQPQRPAGSSAGVGYAVAAATAAAVAATAATTAAVAATRSPSAPTATAAAAAARPGLQRRLATATGRYAPRVTRRASVDATPTAAASAGRAAPEGESADGSGSTHSKASLQLRRRSAVALSGGSGSGSYARRNAAASDSETLHETSHVLELSDVPRMTLPPATATSAGDGGAVVELDPRLVTWLEASRLVHAAELIAEYFVARKAHQLASTASTTVGGAPTSTQGDPATESESASSPPPSSSPLMGVLVTLEDVAALTPAEVDALTAMAARPAHEDSDVADAASALSQPTSAASAVPASDRKALGSALLGLHLLLPRLSPAHRHLRRRASPSPAKVEVEVAVEEGGDTSDAIASAAQRAVPRRGGGGRILGGAEAVAAAASEAVSTKSAQSRAQGKQATAAKPLPKVAAATATAPPGGEVAATDGDEGASGEGEGAPLAKRPRPPSHRVPPHRGGFNFKKAVAVPPRAAKADSTRGGRGRQLTRRPGGGAGAAAESAAAAAAAEAAGAAGDDEAPTDGGDSNARRHKPRPRDIIPKGAVAAAAAARRAASASKRNESASSAASLAGRVRWGGGGTSRRRDRSAPGSAGSRSPALLMSPPSTKAGALLAPPTGAPYSPAPAELRAPLFRSPQPPKRLSIEAASSTTSATLGKRMVGRKRTTTAVRFAPSAAARDAPPTESHSLARSAAAATAPHQQPLASSLPSAAVMSLLMRRRRNGNAMAAAEAAMAPAVLQARNYFAPNEAAAAAATSTDGSMGANSHSFGGRRDGLDAVLAALDGTITAAASSADTDALLQSHAKAVTALDHAAALLRAAEVGSGHDGQHQRPQLDTLGAPSAASTASIAALTQALRAPPAPGGLLAAALAAATAAGSFGSRVQLLSQSKANAAPMASAGHVGVGDDARIAQAFTTPAEPHTQASASNEPASQCGASVLPAQPDTLPAGNGASVLPTQPDALPAAVGEYEGVNRDGDEATGRGINDEHDEFTDDIAAPPWSPAATTTTHQQGISGGGTAAAAAFSPEFAYDAALPPTPPPLDDALADLLMSLGLYHSHARRLANHGVTGLDDLAALSSGNLASIGIIGDDALVLAAARSRLSRARAAQGHDGAGGAGDFAFL